MAVQAGVVTNAQVQSPSATLPSRSQSLGAPATWAWIWFTGALLFLLLSYIGGGLRRRGE